MKTVNVYKLTSQALTTYNGFQYKVGVPTIRTSGEGPLCTSGWLHCYTDPLLALLMNPIHAAIHCPRLWFAEALAPLKDDGDGGTKIGTRQLTLIREISYVPLTTEQVVTFGIICAQQVCCEPQWQAWAENWLTGKDRSANAAYAIYTAAADAADAAANAAAYAAAAAANAAHAVANAAAAAAGNSSILPNALADLKKKWPILATIR